MRIRSLGHVTVAIIALLTTPCLKGADRGYFLSLKQKGQLLCRGQIEDSEGTWYDVRICPGYRAPFRSGRRHMRKAKNNMAEYVEAKKYRDLKEHSMDAYDWAFDDCFVDFAYEGTGKAWRKYWGKANSRAEKRVFGWWMAHPWAVMQGTVDNLIRIPMGVTGMVAGAAWGTIAVPAWHATNSTVAATFNATFGGVALPVSAAAWNTVVSPTMALAGQKPSQERVDGFWVRVVNPNADPLSPPSSAELDTIVAWGRAVHEEMATPNRELDALKHGTTQEIRRLNARIKLLKSKERDTNRKIRENEAKRTAGMVGDPQYREIVGRLRREGWSRRRVSEFRRDIERRLSKAGLPPEVVRAIVTELRRFPFDKVAIAPAGDLSEKTDPVKESLRVIDSIE